MYIYLYVTILILYYINTVFNCINFNTIFIILIILIFNIFFYFFILLFNVNYEQM